MPKHTLPSGNILNVALSPVAEQKLHAHLNDTTAPLPDCHCKFVLGDYSLPIWLVHTANSSEVVVERAALGRSTSAGPLSANFSSVF